ncbi:MAG: hypothetical protein E7302_12985 [Butyrivibrio sp.]|nr:hypothetical protein [Butyrivibrio sp.]
MRIITTILAFVLSALLTIIGTAYLFTGSLEMYPTPEQIETARIAASFIIFMGISFGVCGILLVKRGKHIWGITI